MKKLATTICCAGMGLIALAGCSSNNSSSTTTAAPTTAAVSTTAKATGTTAPSTTVKTTGTSAPGTTLSPNGQLQKALGASGLTDEQLTCVGNAMAAQPDLVSAIQMSKVSMSNATLFVNTMLNCMPMADLAKVSGNMSSNPNSPQTQCLVGKIAAMTPEQVAGIIAEDPATIQAVEPSLMECAPTTTVPAG